MSTFDPVGWQWGAIALTAAAVILAVILVGGIAMWRRGVRARRTAYDIDGYGFAMSATMAAVLLAFAVGGMLVASGGGHPRYFQVLSVSGTVEQVSNRLADASGEITGGDLVVTLSGLDQPVVSEDLRLIRMEGTDVDLRCVAIWHHLAADEYRCVLGTDR